MVYICNLSLPLHPSPWQPQICYFCESVCISWIIQEEIWCQRREGLFCAETENILKLIKNFLFDYTLEDGIASSLALSLTQLAPEECKGWVGSFPTWEWKEATYHRDDGSVRNAAAAGSSSTLWDNRFAIFQRRRQLTGKLKKMHSTTSLSGGLDRSGHVFKAAMAKYTQHYRRLCLKLPRAQVCI